MKANARDLWLQEVSVSALKILAQGMLDDLNDDLEENPSEPREVASAFLYLYKLIKEEGTNIFDLLKYKNVIITSSSVKKIQQRVLNEKN